MKQTMHKKISRWWLLLPASLVCALAMWLFMSAKDNLRAQGAASLQAAVQRAAVQCYAVEGIYPPTVEYLERNYGVQINHDAYIVAYDVFASNRMPNIQVLTK